MEAKKAGLILRLAPAQFQRAKITHAPPPPPQKKKKNAKHTDEKFKCNVGLEASTCIILRKSFVDFTFVVESFLDDFITSVFGHVTSSND